MKQHILALFVSALLPFQALAQQAESVKFGVLSLIGDSFSVVTYQRSVGSHSDTNLKEPVVLSERVFDNVALVAANGALQDVATKKEIAFLAAGAKAVYPEAARLFDGDKFVPPDWLAQSLAQQGVPRLILITKHRANADIRLRGETIGAGKVEGLGFYVDRFARLVTANTGETSTGFIAPFAYLRISLIDIPTLTVVGQHLATGSFIVTPEDTKQGVDPWNTLTSAQKLQALQQLVEQAVHEAIPRLIPPVPREPGPGDVARG